MKIDKKLLDIIKNFKQVDCKLTIEDVAKSIDLLKGIDIKNEQFKFR